MDRSIEQVFGRALGPVREQYNEDKSAVLVMDSDEVSRRSSKAGRTSEVRSDNVNGALKKSPSRRIILTSTSELPQWEPNALCMLGLSESDPHNGRCDIVMSSSLLKHMVSESAEPTVELDELSRLTSASCKPFILENNCWESNCARQHTIGPFSKGEVLVSFAKWFLNNSKQPNSEVLYGLVSQLPQCEDLLPLLLRISSALPKLSNKPRKRIRTALVRKIVRFCSVEPWEAVRIILMYNLTQKLDTRKISLLLNCLGMSELKTTKMYESFGCVLHLISYTFPHQVLLKMVGECVKERPGDLRLTKNRLVSDLLKHPREVLLKKFNIVDSFLCKYYPANSRVAHYVRNFVQYGAEPADLDFAEIDSRKVRSTGEVNRNWRYWDPHEEKLRAFQMVINNSNPRLCEQEETEHRKSYPEGLTMIPFEDDVSSDVLRILRIGEAPTTDLLAGLAAAIEHRRYAEAAAIIGNFDQTGIMTTTRNSLVQLGKKELIRAVLSILRAIPSSRSNCGKNSLIRVVNDIVVMFYRRRDHTGALLLLKALRIAKVNPLEHTPPNIRQNIFILACSDMHFEERCFKEAVKILFYGNCVRFDDVSWDRQHFRLLERLALKMLELFVREGRAELSVAVFRGLVLAQRDLRKPIDLTPFYEGVLRISCDDHEGAILYDLVDRTCGNDLIFRVTTYRVLLVGLVKCRASENLLRRTLLLCLKLRLYPPFIAGTILLAASLTGEEMLLYVRHYLRYWLAQGGTELTSQPLTVKIKQTLLPSDNNPLPAHMRVANDIAQATLRFTSVLKRIVGLVYDDLFIDSSTPGELTIPTIGVEALVEAFIIHEPR